MQYTAKINFEINGDPSFLASYEPWEEVDYRVTVESTSRRDFPGHVASSVAHGYARLCSLCHLGKKVNAPGSTLHGAPKNHVFTKLNIVCVTIFSDQLHHAQFWITQDFSQFSEGDFRERVRSEIAKWK